jgi:putative tryptophan/tyrosine transport system substrate-binding protein
MRRREFITLLSGVAVGWPLTLRAQQPTKPVVGFLNPASPESQDYVLAPLRDGLKEAGYAEGENVVIEYRWAEGKYNRLPELAADLVARRVNVIATGLSTPAALAAKAATKEIPIVFAVGEDPVRLGLVANLARPDANATGINFFVAELTAKRLGLLHELLPKAARIGVLVNPSNVGTTEPTVRDAKAAALTMGLEVHAVSASNGDEIDIAFRKLVSERTDALLVAPDLYLNSRRVQIAILAAHYSVPTIYTVRNYAEAGGLISYGTNSADALRQQGIYIGRILKGTKPADLPVEQSTKFELVINLRTAKALGLEIPPPVLARADEVIE